MIMSAHGRCAVRKSMKRGAMEWRGPSYEVQRPGIRAGTKAFSTLSASAAVWPLFCIQLMTIFTKCSR